MNAPDYDDAASAFRVFLAQQGYPDDVLWITQDDIVVHKWRGAPTYFVRKGSPPDREENARREYQRAVSSGVGVALQAHSRADGWTIGSVFVAKDEDEAQYLMMPATGIKQSAAINPLPAILVESKWLWRLLKWWKRNAVPVLL